MEMSKLLKKISAIVLTAAMVASLAACATTTTMAMLVLAILPIIIFCLIAQKSIIKGVISGAVKG